MTKPTTCKRHDRETCEALYKALSGFSRAFSRPDDRAAISLHVWNEGMKAANEEARAALRMAEEEPVPVAPKGLDPEARQKAVEAVAVALGGGTSDPDLWDIHMAVCEEAVDEAITAYLAHRRKQGVAEMPRIPHPDVAHPHSPGAAKWITYWDQHAEIEGVEPGNVIRFVEWRPIGTAPKDGTKVLLGKIVGHPDHDTALWWAVRGFWSERWQNWNDGVEPSGLADPTHWLPLSAYGAHAKETDDDSHSSR